MWHPISVKLGQEQFMRSHADGYMFAYIDICMNVFSPYATAKCTQQQTYILNRIKSKLLALLLQHMCTCVRTATIIYYMLPTLSLSLC